MSNYYTINASVLPMYTIIFVYSNALMLYH